VLFLGERFNRGRLLALVGGFAGILVILRPGLDALPPAALVMLAAAAGFGFINVLTKRLTRTDQPVTILFWMCAAQTLLALPLSLAHWTTPALAEAPWLVLVGLCGLSAHYCLNKGLSLADATVVLPMEFLRLPVIALAGLALYREPLDPWVLAGGAIIATGVWLNLRVPLRWLTMGEGRPTSLRSGRKAEDLVYKGPLRRHVVPRHGPYLALGEHRHRLHPGQRPPSRPEALEPQHGSRPALDPAVVLLDQVVEPAAAPVPGEAPELAVALHLPDRAGVALEAVGDDGPRVARVLATECLAEEALGRLLVARGAEQEVDRLPGAVDGPVQVAPAPADPDEGLVDVPRPAARPQVAAHPLLELGGEALDPAVQGDVVDEDAPVGEHGLEVAVADREGQVPAHRPEDDLGREAEAAEGPGRGHRRRSSCGWREAPLLAAREPPLDATAF
jgi:EamA-like transporter family